MKNHLQKIALGAFLSLSMGIFAQNNSEKATKLLGKILTMDTHLHIDVPMASANMPFEKIDLPKAMQKAGMNAVGMTFAVDYVPLTRLGQPYERFENGISAQAKILKDNNLTLSLNGKDVKKNLKKKQPIVIQSVEGGHFLEGDISRLEKAYKQGLRMFCLLHDNDATPPLGDVYTNIPKYGGLTELGAKAIKESERLGILVDLAHCDSLTIEMALKTATKPVIISHTGLNTRLGNNDFMAKMMKKRLISPELAKKVAQKGGVIGVWTHLTSSPAEFVKNIRAMVDVVGVDYVCIGTDSKITPEFSDLSPEERAKFFSQQHKNNGDDKKEGENKPKPMPKKDPNAINHIWNAEKTSFYHSVITAMLDEGFTEKEITKICGLNFLRVFDKATKK